MVPGHQHRFLHAAGVEMAVFLVPVSIVQYMPNLFYGALLCAPLCSCCVGFTWLTYQHLKPAVPTKR